MADKVPNVPPPSKPFPGSLTPGWNDPPPINNEFRSQGRPKVCLNKRVAFPVQGMSTENYAKSNTLPMGCGPPSYPDAIVPPLKQELSDSTK